MKIVKSPNNMPKSMANDNVKVEIFAHPNVRKF